MIISDNNIFLASGLVSNTDFAFINPASVDLRLGSLFKKIKSVGPSGVVDTADLSAVSYKEWCSDFLIIEPGILYLASTVESVHLPLDLVGIVSGKSSLARLGVSVHATAGFVDPGFEGEITLEISVVGKYPVKVYAGQRIAQISFTQTTQAVSRGYEKTGRYQGQKGPTESRL